MKNSTVFLVMFTSALAACADVQEPVRPRMTSDRAVNDVAPHGVGGPTTVIYSNFGSGFTFDTSPLHGWTINGLLGPGIGQQAISQQFFTPSGKYTFARAIVALSHSSGPSGIRVFLQADSLGRPGHVVEEMSIDSIGDAPAVYTVNSTLSPVLRDTLYWLTVAAGGPGVLAGWNWNTIGDRSSTTFASTQGGGPNGPWGIGLEETRSAFQIEGRLVPAATCPLCVVPPTTIVRTAGPPDEIEQRFSADQQQDYRLTIRLVAGRTLAVQVVINDQSVVMPRDLLKSEADQFSVIVRLRQTNTARIRITGTPGASLEYRIEAANGDKTPPTLALSSGEADRNTYQAAGAAGNYFLSALDAGGAGIGTYGGPGSLFVAQTRLWNDLNPATFDPTVFEGQVFSTNANAALIGGTYIAAVGSAATPCVIGRFNASATKAGPNALTVFLRDGSTAGFCTPVAYTPTAGPSNTFGVPAASISALGYFKTQVIATDLANNVAANTFTATVLEDNSLPTIINIDLPAVLVGGTTVTFPAAVADATAGAVGDITGSWATLTYSVTGFVLQYPVSTAGAGIAFDNVLTRSAIVVPPVQNFIKNLQVSTGGTTAPTSTSSTTTAGAAGAPSSLTISAIDAANNVSTSATGTFSLSAAPVVITGSGTNFTAAGSGATFFTGGFAIAASATNVTNCPASGCGPSGSTAAANPTTTVIAATASGTSSVFNNPFAAGTVQLWYRPTGTTTFFLAPASDVTIGSVSIADNGTQRFWIYNLTWNPPAATPASALGVRVNLSPASAATINVDVMIVGVNGNGDGVATPIQVITLTNP